MKQKLTRKGLKEVPMRPYPGMIFVTQDWDAFERAAFELFGKTEIHTNQCGRFLAGASWYHPHTRILWWTTPETLVHELGHVVLDLFELIGVDPCSGNGEPFCYMLSQLHLEILD